MKYKLIYMILAVGLIITAVFASVTKIKQTHRNEFQHISAMQEQNNTSDAFETHLPIVQIDTDDQPIIKPVQINQFTNAKISIIDNQNTPNHLDSKYAINTQAQIKIRGNSSSHFEKKSYQITFINDDLSNHKVKVMGMPKNDKWILNGPFLDKTLMRNYLLMNLSAEIMGYAPRVRYCEVFLNQQYQGLYLMMEPISQGEKRISIADSEDDNDYTSYILRMDRGSMNESKNLNNFTKYTMNMHRNTKRNNYLLNIEYPTNKYLTDAKIEYIEKDFSQFEKALYSFDFNTKDYGYNNYIDVNSFIDYYIINEFFQNYDATLYSTYLYKDIRGKIHIGPVWDFNNAMDNYVDQTNEIEQTVLEKRLWYSMLFKDEKFVDHVLYRYKELRKSTLSEDNMLQHIDAIEKYLGSAIERNFAVWGFSFDYNKINENSKLLPEKRHISSYDQAITQMKNYIKKRGRWLDENIEYLKQFSHESATKKYRH